MNVAVLQKVKAPASAPQAKSNHSAPMSDFIISDDDVQSVSDNSNESDGDIENDAYASPLQMIRSISDKENRPITKVTKDSDKVSPKLKHAVNSISNTALTGSNSLLESVIVVIALSVSHSLFYCHFFLRF